MAAASRWDVVVLVLELLSGVRAGTSAGAGVVKCTFNGGNCRRDQTVLVVVYLCHVMKYFRGKYI